MWSTKELLKIKYKTNMRVEETLHLLLLLLEKLCVL